MKTYIFCILLSFLFTSSLFARTSAPDPMLKNALTNVFHSKGIAPKTCLENIQVLIRSALKVGAQLSNAEAVIFEADGDFLRPNSARWPEPPLYNFHVVLMKDGWVYDFATQTASGDPEVHRVKDYFPAMFPRNERKNLRFKVIPALGLLLPEHQNLPMDDDKSYPFIKKVWDQNGQDYRKIAFGRNTTLLTYRDLVKARRASLCSNGLSVRS